MLEKILIYVFKIIKRSKVIAKKDKELNTNHINNERCKKLLEKVEFRCLKSFRGQRSLKKKIKKN